MDSIGKRIKQRRKSLALTQDELCLRSGISKGFLSDVENDKRNISSSNLLDIANALGCSCDYLLTGKASPDFPHDISIPAALAKFAETEGLTFKQATTLLGMQRQILAHRTSTKKDALDLVDWSKLYHSVKEFLDHG